MGETILQQIHEAADLLYQNKEQEGLAQAAQMIGIFKNAVLQGGQSGIDPVGVTLLKELLDCYQNADVLGLADALEYGMTEYLQGKSGVCSDPQRAEQKDYLRQNCENLIEKIPEQKEALERWVSEFEGCEDMIQYTRKGEAIPVIRHNERAWYLNSRYDAAHAAKILGERYREKKPYFVYYVFGFSDGRAIRELLSHMDDTNQMLIYEPNIDVFLSVMSQEDYEDIIADERVFLLVGDKEIHHLDSYIGALTSYNRKDLLEFVILPGYDVLYSEECSRYMETILYVKRHTMMSRNTAIVAQDALARNIFSNFYEIVNGTDINRLKEIVETYDLKDIPAIIVSAGPSLDHNIEELKAAEGKAFILVVDAAAKAVLRAGIQGWIMITVDPNKELSLFDDERIQETPMVAESYSRMEILLRHKAKKVFSYGWGSDILAALMKDCLNYEPKALPTGGSVANDAFSLVEYLGFQTIILVGQDLAFTGDRGHVSSVCDDEEANRDHLKTRALTMVEGWDGQPIKTDLQMEMYLRWFEKEIRNLKDGIKVIDATEGGAKKEGAIPMTLRDAIASECRGEFSLDQVLSECQDTCSPQQKEKAYETVRGLPRELERVRKNLKEGIACHQELARLAKRGQTGTKEFRKCVAKVERCNERQRTEWLQPLIAMYASVAEYSLQDQIYAQEDMSISEIAEQGIELLEGYQKALDDLEKDLPILLEHLPE